jgi:hypothetical protein
VRPINVFALVQLSGIIEDGRMNAGDYTRGSFGGYRMAKEDEKVKWYLRPISVIVSLFFVLGPFGLPLLYRSPKFSRTMKVLLTVAVVAYTFYLVFVSLEIAKELYRRMDELREILG